MSAPATIDRGFVRLDEGLVHYRHSGAGLADALPLYLAHPGPGSSRGQIPLLGELGKTRWTIAPDMLGNGDSAPPAREDTDIAYYADCAVRVLDALGVEQVDFLGSHTGALIGIELSRRHGDRVRRLVLDGVMLLEPADRARMQAEYAPRIVPDHHGGHLAWAYQFCRDMMLFYPYFERNPAHRTNNGVPSPELMHPFVVDVLKALPTYHCAYNAAFAFDVTAALPHVAHRTLMTCTQSDPLHGDLPRAAELLPAAETHLHPIGTPPAVIAERITRFLAAA